MCVQVMEAARSPVGAAISLTWPAIPLQEVGTLLVHQLPPSSSSSVPSRPSPPAHLSSLPLISFSFICSFSFFPPSISSRCLSLAVRRRRLTLCVCVYAYTHERSHVGEGKSVAFG